MTLLSLELLLTSSVVRLVGGRNVTVVLIHDLLGYALIRATEFGLRSLEVYVLHNVRHLALPYTSRNIITSDLVQTTATLRPFPADSSHASGTCRDRTLKRDDFKD